MSTCPQLQSLLVVGGALSPGFDTGATDYIELQEGWNGRLMLNFEVGLGQASEFEFCCARGNCQAMQAAERPEALSLKAQIPVLQFGTCHLVLQGLRRKQYTFTVISLQALNALVQPPIKVAFSKFEVKQNAYKTRIIRPSDMSRISLSAQPKFDEAHLQTRCTGVLCRRDVKSCVSSEVSADSTGWLNFSTPAPKGEFNITLLISLLPRSSDMDRPKTYVLSVKVIDGEARLSELAQTIAALEGKLDAMQDFHKSDDFAEAQAALDNAMRERNSLLFDAYNQKGAEDVSSHEMPLTFLAGGLTGTGKSELCRWMTSKGRECAPSSSMESNTSQVNPVEAHPLGDSHTQPAITWIDTPGRGDTRGQKRDEELWKGTMTYLSHHAIRIDSIVWVINAAWQRGTSQREMMFSELRAAFGMHLYKHLVIVLNYMPHSANRSQHEEELERKRRKFSDWLLDMERAMYSWQPWLWQGVRQEINSIHFYGVSIDPEYLQELPTSLPLSAPFLSNFPPFSYPAGVPKLIDMFEATRAHKASGNPGLDVDNKHPRIGPGQLLSASASRTCGFFQVSLVNVQGSYFSADDRAVLLPASAQCGDPDAANWAKNWQQVIASPSRISGDNKSAVYEIQAGGLNSKLCFCEALSCKEEPSRFGQQSLLEGIERPNVSQHVLSLGLHQAHLTHLLLKDAQTGATARTFSGLRILIPKER